MLYSCEPVSAEQLREWGTVLDVVPAGELMDRAREIAGVIASKSAPVIRAAKASLLGIDHAPMNSYRFEQGFTYELNLQGHGDEAVTRSCRASERELGGRLTPLIRASRQRRRGRPRVSEPPRSRRRSRRISLRRPLLVRP